MRVLVIHNQYLHRGGEDVVIESDRELLESNGHTVLSYVRNNEEIKGTSPVAVARNSLWSRESVRDVDQLVRMHRPDVAHVHNLFPLISPSVLWLLRGASIPIVMTLHNFRLVCANGLLLRDGSVCELCVNRRVPWPAVRHACYQDNRVRTSGVVVGQMAHRALGSYRRNVSRFIAPTRFVAGKAVLAGIPPERVVLRPHVLPYDPGEGSHEEPVALFVGRLAPEKGISTLLQSWKRRRSTRLSRLRVVGDGPDRGKVLDAAATDSSIQWMGSMERHEVLDLMRRSRFLVVPSAAYEAFGLILLEAFASGLPVIASGHGALRELVTASRGGRVFQPGCVDELASCIDTLANDDELCGELGKRARKAYEQHFAPDVGYKDLLNVYVAAGAPT